MFIAATLTWVVGAAVVLTVLLAILGGTSALLGDDGGTLGLSFGYVLISAVFGLVVAVVEAVFIRAALLVTAGRRPQFGEFFQFPNFNGVVLTALLLAAVQLVLSLVSWIPLLGWALSLVVNFLLFFTLFFVVDKHLSPVDAVRASVELIRRNLNVVVLLYLLVVVTVIVGAALCGLGLLVAIPVALVASACIYKQLLGEPVAP